MVLSLGQKSQNQRLAAQSQNRKRSFTTRSEVKRRRDSLDSESIRRFLAEKPSLSQILEFVESEAQRIVAEKKKAEGVK